MYYHIKLFLRCYNLNGAERYQRLSVLQLALSMSRAIEIMAQVCTMACFKTETHGVYIHCAFDLTMQIKNHEPLLERLI